MELVAPIGSWGGFDEVVVTVRKGLALMVARRGDDYIEKVISLSEVPDKVLEVARAYNELLASIAEALNAHVDLPSPSLGNISEWLDSYSDAMNRLNSLWGREVDRVGPFRVEKLLDVVYIPYIGSSATATYVIQPFRHAIVRAENRGRSMALGSVEVVWQESTVVKAGIRTVAGAVLLAQAEPSLHRALPAMRSAVDTFVGRLMGVVANI